MSHKLLLFSCCLLSVLVLTAQQPVQSARRSGWTTQAYRIPADTAQQYLRKDDISPDALLRQSPFAVFFSDSGKEENLPTGNYILVQAINNELQARYYCSSELKVFAVNNGYRVQLEIRKKDGTVPYNASVWVDGEKAVSQDGKSFLVSDKKPDDALVRVAIPGDTLFMQLKAMGIVKRSPWQQWWRRFATSKAGYYVSWPVRSVKTMVTRPPRYWFQKRSRPYSGNKGYMIFSKPVYKPGDTLKLKAYVLTKKQKLIRKPLDLFFSYYARGKYQEKKIASLRPVTPSAFVYEWRLADSLQSDINYTVELRNRKGKELLTSNFKIEDYLLDEVASYNLRAEKQMGYARDTLHFFASAKDANGLGLMDGKVTLHVVSRSVRNFYQPEEFVPDTLFSAEKTLQVEGETRFDVPSHNFPNADIELGVVAVFRNSNNEIQEKMVEVDFLAARRSLQVKQEGAAIKVLLIENGKPVEGRGWFKEDNSPEKMIRFPFEASIHPYTKSYEFFTRTDAGEISEKETHRVQQQGNIVFRVEQKKDSAGFTLQNPFRLPVHYIVFDGPKVITKGTDTAAVIYWAAVLPVKKQYRVQWNYVWAGEEIRGSQNIAVTDKMLQASITGAAAVYPGQTDTLTVQLKDYKDRPAEAVNLTAVSYNSQFKENRGVDNPPYLKKYRQRRRTNYDHYRVKEAELTAQYLLGRYPGWVKRLSLDTMLYYRMLFPEDSLFIAEQPVKTRLAQLSVHVVQQGVPQEIYLLYVNREFAYYNGVTSPAAYVFPVLPGYTQVGFRLRDRFIQVDSILLTAGKKYDLVFDLDKLPARAKEQPMPAHYQIQERASLEGWIFQLYTSNYSGDNYLWQSNKLVRLKDGYVHQVGPFRPSDSLQFFQKGVFDLKFPFESGYQYQLSPRMARLEKRALFSQSYKKKIKLPPVAKTNWVLGDTLPAPPVIVYLPLPVRPYFKVTDWGYNVTRGKDIGTLRLLLPEDSVFRYIVIHSRDYDSVYRIKSNNLQLFSNIKKGYYDVILVTPSWQYLSAENIFIDGGGVTCLDLRNHGFAGTNAFAERLGELYEKEAARQRALALEAAAKGYTVSGGMAVPSGSGAFSGKLVDEKGNPVYGASIQLKGYNRGVASVMDGSFAMKNLGAGTYTIVISAVGYETFEHTVVVTETVVSSMQLMLKPASKEMFSEVVVTGYGAARLQGRLTYNPGFGMDNDEMASFRGNGFKLKTQRSEAVTATSKSNPLALQWMNPLDYSYGDVSADSAIIRIRGISGIKGDVLSLYLINGVLMESIPEDLDMQHAQVSVMDGKTAAAVYGATAANGIIIINTSGFMPKTLRDEFRDYAVWKPNFFSDKNGEAKIVITYPDNITSWETYVVGMDKKKRIAKTAFYTKSFKPLLAQLALPQFLVEGDSANFVGKAVNYSTTTAVLQTIFMVNGAVKNTTSKEVPANGSVTEELLVSPSTTDTIAAQYGLETATGFRDGELRRIPVLRKGTIEARGEFWTLAADTAFTFIPDTHAGQVVVHAQNNTLDVLLDELKHLKEYPFFCMEQTASKLTGLLMEKDIRRQLKQEFKGEREIQKLLQKLEESQLFDGGWAWWSQGKPNTTVTNYVLQALLPLRKDPVVESSLRNGLLFLQNNLAGLRKTDLLYSLSTLSEAGHVMDYGYYLKNVYFDSLTQHQQWLYVKIKQQQKMEHEREMQYLLNKKTATMLGGLHWGDDSFDWAGNDMATTALAYTVLEKDAERKHLLPSLVQYFLEQRRGGRWRNTVESARTVQTILPYILRQQTDFIQPAQVTVNQEPAFTAFPFTYVLPDATKPVQFAKSGGGLVYLTAWQQVVNPQPQAVTDKFDISTWFERTGSAVAALKAGEKAVMKVKVNVLKDADYVQLTIPIPAGCTYAAKKQEGGDMHREYLKDRVVIFAESLQKGIYDWEVELEPRYTGSYQLNPVRAELMYFPVFYGRNEMKRVQIR